MLFQRKFSLVADSQVANYRPWILTNRQQPPKTDSLSPAQEHDMISITHRIASAALAFIMLIPLAPAALAQHNDNFYRGAQRHHPYNDGYDRRRYHEDRNRGGVGPGKGALIGGASGAILGPRSDRRWPGRFDAWSRGGHPTRTVRGSARSKRGCRSPGGGPAT